MSSKEVGGERSIEDGYDIVIALSTAAAVESRANVTTTPLCTHMSPRSGGKWLTDHFQGHLRPMSILLAGGIMHVIRGYRLCVLGCA